MEIDNLNTTISSTSKNKFPIILILIISFSCILLIFAGWFFWKKQQSEPISSSTSDHLQAATINIEDNLTTITQNLNWLNDQKSQRHLYIDWAGQIVDSNRAFIPVLWAKYQAYLATHNLEQLQSLKEDIETAKTVVLDGYSQDNYKNIIQNNSFNCYLMKDLVNNADEIFTADEQNTLKRFCTDSTYELIFQPEINYFYPDLNDQLRALPVSFDQANAVLIETINQKITLINNQQITNYNIADDQIYREFTSSYNNATEEAQFNNTAQFPTTMTKGYYYFVLDQIARYQLEPTTNNEYLSLVLLNDLLSIYIWDQQWQTPIYADLGNCLLEKTVQAAQKTLPNGSGMVSLTLSPYQPQLSLTAAINDDRTYHPTTACWVVQLQNSDNQEWRNNFQLILTQNDNINQNNPQVSNSIVENSFLFGLLSKITASEDMR